MKHFRQGGSLFFIPPPLFSWFSSVSCEDESEGAHRAKLNEKNNVLVCENYGYSEKSVRKIWGTIFQFNSSGYQN